MADNAKMMEETLGKAQIFSQMSTKSLRRMAQTAHSKHFAAGEMILNEGEPGIALYVLASGGAEVLRRLRQSSPIPVLMLTARAEEVDRVIGLELGADD